MGMEQGAEKMEQGIEKVIVADEIRKWHHVFKRDGELFEIRLLGDTTYSGYFTDVEKAIEAITPFDRTKLYQIYFTVNEVISACSSRKQYNNFLRVKGSATSKNDIAHRWFIPIDIDVKRPSDISSTKEEKKYAYDKACEVYLFMKSVGFPLPIVCDSSSGYHLYYPVDLPNNVESEELVKSLFAVLSSRFTDDRVKIDAQVGDANRIMRLPGSWGRKGRDSEDRPHRLACILSIPDSIFRADRTFIEAFVEKYKIVEDKSNARQWNGNNEQFDIRSFIRDHDLKVRNETSYGVGGTKFVLEECPFDSSHKAPDSAIFVSANGAIGFKCFHDSCSHHDWHELRQMLDPSAYEPRQSQQPIHYRQYRPTIPVPEVKVETPEIGKKWLDLDDVADVNLDDMPRIHTGFKEIDYVMGGGLFLGETTILSGINGSGKSAWLNTLILNAIQDSNNSALWTGELQAARLKRWLVQAAAGGHVKESTKSPGKFYVEKYYIDKIVRWLHGKFKLYNNDYSSNYAQLLSDIKEVIGLGVRLIVLDNLFSMDLTGMEGDMNEKQTTLIKNIVEVSKTYNVHIILVAHPRKVVTFLRKEDILGSSALQNAVDNIFIFHRRGKDFERRASEFFDKKDVTSLMKYGNVIEICKNREFGSLEKLIGLYYNTSNRHFYDDDGDFPYRWDTQPVQQTMSFEQTNTNNEDIPFARQTDEDAPF